MGLDWDDWGRWIRGLIGAGISGAASSITAGGVASWVVPKEVNINTSEGFHNLLTITWITALAAFIVSISKYLAQKPLPEDDGI